MEKRKRRDTEEESRRRSAENGEIPEWKFDDEKITERIAIQLQKLLKS